MSAVNNSMVYYAGWKKVTTILIALLAILYAAPNFMPKEWTSWADDNLARYLPGHRVNLGLDLQGGSYLLLKVDVNVALHDRLTSAMDGVRASLQKERIGYQNLMVVKQENTGVPEAISFKLREADAFDRVAKLVRDVDSDLVVSRGDGEGQVMVSLTEQALIAYQADLLGRSIEIVRRRIDESGTKEPIIQRSGTDRIMLQLPGVSNPEEVKRLLGQTAKMTFHLVDENATMAGALAVPPGFVALPDRDEPNRRVVIERKPALSGDTLTNAQASVTQNGQPAVSFRFDSAGGRKFAEITKANTGQMFAIVLDGQVLTAPVIREPITGGSGQIDGNFTVASANELALLLRAGALPAPLTVLEERTVGPGLGQDAVDAGKWSGALGLALVFAFMMLCYGRFGLYANIALVVNLAMTFAVMTVMGATLTLPGIAGLVLTMGMAVDANVLIYERIREELRQGRTVLASVDAGYNRAMSSIIDGNLTTVISGLIMFMLGSGPIRGFAVTLTLGILTSMFAAIMITRLMVLRDVRNSKGGINL